MERGSGLLVHVASLPSPYGIGTFGADARRFIRFLAKAKQKYWQILPLNPTSFGDSPYQSFSAFAINPYFIDLKYLVKKGFLYNEDLAMVRYNKNSSEIDYGRLYETRFEILKLAYQRGYELEKDKIEHFFKQNKSWLDDYALFMTIKKMFNDVSWQEWPKEYKMHKKEILNIVRISQSELYNFYIFLQYEAFTQYRSLKKYAKRNHIKIIGDMPIYVALDSADIWANSRYFLLDRKRRPTKVAGVPPDYFSSTGQLWGNPIYDWEKMKKYNYKWWRKRVKMMSKLYDVIRVDHFRGFDTYWAVDAKEKTAVNGKWYQGPGYDFFKSLEKEFSKVEVIAEDLGILTDSVRSLKEKCGFPGLKLYQFAFDDYQNHLRGEYGIDYERFKSRLEHHYDDVRLETLNKLCNAYLPHNYEHNCVAYIGTHDNDVEINHLRENKNLWDYMLDYLQISNPSDILDTMIGSLMRSNADVVIFMPQDLLHMDKETRINVPGRAYGNWKFRFRREHFNNELANHLAIMVDEANR